MWWIWSATAAFAWWDPAWSQRARLTLDNPTDEDLVDLVVPVWIDAAILPLADVAAGGADLRWVAEDDATVRPHDLEAWGPAGGVLWVSVPLLPANDAVDLWLYYGNPAAASGADPDTTWGPDWVAVWHFAGSGADSSGAHRDLVPEGNPAWVDSPLGPAVDLDGQQDLLVRADDPTDFDLATPTVLAWVSVRDWASDWAAIVAHAPGGWALQRFGTDDLASFGVSQADGGSDLNLRGTSPIAGTGWRLVAGTYDGAAITLSVDGDVEARLNESGGLAATFAPLTVGSAKGQVGGRLFDGQISEVQLASVPLTEATLVALNALGRQAGVGWCSVLQLSDGDADGDDCLTDCDDSDPDRDTRDADGDGDTSCGGDCDDVDPGVGPHATEIAGNTTDEDCDGIAADAPGGGSGDTPTFDDRTPPDAPIASAVGCGCGAVGGPRATPAALGAIGVLLLALRRERPCTAWPLSRRPGGAPAPRAGG
jgi:MYXO-CTERM domain-containing protein